jgi:hypothetical protein
MKRGREKALDPIFVPRHYLVRVADSEAPDYCNPGDTCLFGLVWATIPTNLPHSHYHVPQVPSLDFVAD